MTKLNTRQFLIILLVLAPTFAFAFRSFQSRQLSFYYGQTYRINDHFYNTFDLSYEKLNTWCTGGRYRGAGIRLDYFNNNNFAIGLNYFKSFARRPTILAPYIGIAPNIFRFNNATGVNIKPNIGFRLAPFLYSGSPIGICLNVSYGYDVPIINENNFSAGRHDLSARLSLSFDLDFIRLSLKRGKENENSNS